MKILFDTSVLVAAMVSAHPGHQPAFSWLQRARRRKIEGYVAAHSVLEVYSVLTRAPFQPRISTETAQRMIQKNIRPQSTIVALTEQDYFTIIDRMSASHIIGGAVYDALVVQCAEKAGVDHILTFNTQHFLQLLPDEPDKIMAPF